MKIVVLAGGLSPERNVSLVTGASVCKALRENGHQAVLLDLFLGLDAVPDSIRSQTVSDPESFFSVPDGLCPSSAAGISTQEPDMKALWHSRKDQSPSVFGPGVLDICRRADIVFIALHGMDGEDGRVQAAFDLFGIPYTGSGYLAAGIAMDKAKTKRMMESAGIPTPSWRPLRYESGDIPALSETLPMPCVIKNTIGGSSLGVFLPADRAELRHALEQVGSYGGEVFWEQRITGRELTVGVLGDQALPAVEILPAEGEFDYTAKYQAGGAREICPAPVTAAQQKEAGRLALLLHQTIGLEVYSRTDFILDQEGKFWCLEVNTLPGLTPASLVPKEAAAAGMSYNALCEKIVKESLRLRRRG